MMVHLLGGGVVTLACVWAGWQGRQWYYRRWNRLNRFCHALARMEAELGSWETDTWTLMSLLAEEDEFFRRLCRKENQNGEDSFSTLWTNTMNEMSLPLTEEERTLLNRTGTVLGRYDGKTQAFLLGNIRVQLQHCTETARQQAARQGRMVVLFSLSAGLTLTVLLIS